MKNFLECKTWAKQQRGQGRGLDTLKKADAQGT